MSEERARKIKLLLMDVDGVMTDGSLWFFPAPAGARQETRSAAGKFADAGGYAISSASFVEAKGFHAHDGTAISLARLGGLKTGLITKRISDTVALRARDLRLDHVHQGIADKLTVFHQILRQEKLSAEQAAYIGDDIIDLPIMEHCGLAIAVPNSRAEVLQAAHFVTEHPGGHGAVRDAVEFILKAQGKLQQVIDSYLQGRSPEKKTGKKN
ncbi:MAG: HAD hydrolase family protein [Acidobacteriia bacterium]|nr:HAD hydrolase family protein [Terriglobia bacterium]